MNHATVVADVAAMGEDVVDARALELLQHRLGVLSTDRLDGFEVLQGRRVVGRVERGGHAAPFGAEAQPAPPASAQTLVRTQTAPRTAALTTESNRQVITEAFRRWAAGGRTFFQDVLAADVVWTIKGTSPAAGTYRGREDFIDRAVRPFTDRLASPVQPTVQGIWADADHVIVQWDGAGTAADGAPYRNSYVWIFRMVDQRAVEVVAFLDLVPYDDVIRRVPRPMPTVPADRASSPSAGRPSAPLR